MSALSLAAADALVDAATAAIERDARAAADMAPLIRGHARDSDGAAFALFRRLGLTDAEIAKTLPQARAMIAGGARCRR